MKDETKSILGIAYLHTTIVIIFSVIAYLEAYLITGADNIDKHYIINISILFVIFAVTWIALFMLNKKHGQSLGSALHDKTVRKTTGVLLLISCILSLSLYATAFKNVYSQLSTNSDDGTVIPNIISFAIYLCQVFIAIWFLKYKGKTDAYFNADVVIGIAYLYTINSTTFYLLTRLTEPIIYHSSLKKHLLIWLITSILILIVLYILNKKQNKSFISIYQNNMIRKSTGLLLIISSIFSISHIFNSLIDSVWLIQFLGGMDRQAKLGFVLDIVRIVIFSCQIGFGIYMLKYYKNKDIKEDLTH